MNIHVELKDVCDARSCSVIMDVQDSNVTIKGMTFVIRKTLSESYAALERLRTEGGGYLVELPADIPDPVAFAEALSRALGGAESR